MNKVTVSLVPQLQTAFIADVETRIIEIRGVSVIVDKDLAALYGVETRDINKAVRNNPEKFPASYMFELRAAEKQYVVENFHRLENLKFSPHTTKVFTEKGLYMLATILKGKRALSVTFAIIEVFARMRELSQNIEKIGIEKNKEKQKSLLERTNNILNDLLSSEADVVVESESTIELNLAMLKLKRTVKKQNKKNKK